jgi:hypothetical protein
VFSIFIINSFGNSIYEDCWLRWWDKSGNLICWGGELLELERQRAEQAEEKNIRLVERLRAMGVDPEQI